MEGLVIKRNAALVDSALWNVGVPLDRGEYEISGQAPGHEAWSTKIEIATEGQKASVEVPRFKRLDEVTSIKPPPTPVKPPPPKPVATLDKPDSEQEIAEPASPSTFTGMRKAAVAVVAIGVLGIAGGIVFGMKASDLEKQADAICPTAACGDAHAVQLNTDAKSDALYANIGFVAGGVAVGGAVALWFLGAPKVHGEAVSLTPIVSPRSVGFAFGGRF